MAKVKKTKEKRQRKKDKWKKKKQRSTKHALKAKDRVTRTSQKTGGECRCSGRVNTSYSCKSIRSLTITNCTFICYNNTCHCGVCRGHMVVGFMTIYAISGYHYKKCEFESRSCKVYSKKHYVLSLSMTCYMSVVFSRYSGLLHQ
jgi:hypothetical protein